jgi:hypothetical protein
MYVPAILNFVFAQCLSSRIAADVLLLGQTWTAAWAFELVGVVFLFWMMIMAYQVYREL